MQIIVEPANFNVISGPLPNILLGGSGLAALVVNGTSLSGYVPVTGVGTSAAYISGGVLVISGAASGSSSSANTGQLTGAFYPLVANPQNYASLVLNNTFLGTGQNFVSIVNIQPVHTTGQYESAWQIGSGYASVLLMSGVPLAVKQNATTSLYGDNGQIFLENVYTYGAPNSGEFNYLTQLSAFNSSGANSFVTCDATNDGVVTLGTSANMTTLTVSGGNVGVSNGAPAFPIDAITVGNSTGIFTIATANVSPAIDGAASDIHIKGGLGNVAAGGNVVIDAGADQQGYIPQGNIYLNCFPYAGLTAGKVGIGNQSPIFTVDVSGSGNFTAGLYVSGAPVLDTGHIIAGSNISVTASGKYVIVAYTGPYLLYGSGNPNGVVTAPVGSIYSDTGNHVQYNKFSGIGNTGWY